MTPLSAKLVSTARERRAFLSFPWRIYRREPNWVPPVWSERAARLDPLRNPLFQHGEAQAFLAARHGRVVGTIAAAVDHDVNRALGESAATFGFFECIDDEEVSHALFAQVVGWARARNLTKVRGPQSFGGNDEPGVLIEGRETPPVMLMGWAPPYYQRLVEGFGFRKYQDALAYRVYCADLPAGKGDEVFPAKIVRVAEHVRRRYGYSIRHGDLDHWDSEMEVALRIYNRSLATLPNFAPMDRDEWHQQARRLRPLLDPDMALFARVDGRDVGFALALPDANQALWHCGGLRYPWNYLQLWWYSRRIRGLSFKILAMLPEYWGRGLDALLYLEMARATLRKGYHWMDMSLTGEDNPMTNKLALAFGAAVDKRYRVYELDLA